MFTFLLASCAGVGGAVQREEARQLAWTGAGPGPCLFDGVSERADRHCAVVNFGTEGVLMAVNDRAQGGVERVSCEEHVRAVHRELETLGVSSIGSLFSALEECRRRDLAP